MANVRVLSVEPQLRRLAVVVDEIAGRMVSLQARLAVESEGPANPTGATTALRRELAALEDDWRCVASAQASAAIFARAG